MVYTFGESLVDIIISSDQHAEIRAGGSMLNAAVSLARSGIETSLISELGDDRTAAVVLEFLRKNHVHSKLIRKYYHQRTTVALAFLDADKKPEFIIHRAYPEKRRVIPPTRFQDGDILLFGSLYSLDPEIRGDVVHILSAAKMAGTLILYDPNIRHHKLDDQALKKAFRENVAFADIVKGSDEDMLNLFGTGDPAECLTYLRDINPEVMFIMTRGPEGVSGFRGDLRLDFPAHPAEVKSTIGAGDAFNAGVAYYFSRMGHGLSPDDASRLSDLLKCGLEFSAAVCSSMDNYVEEGFSISL